MLFAMILDLVLMVTMNMLDVAMAMITFCMVLFPLCIVVVSELLSIFLDAIDCSLIVNC